METTTQITQQCPLCSSTAVRFYMSKNGYSIYACDACALRFVFPLPGAVTVYNQDYFTGAREGFGYTDYDADKIPMIPVFEEYVRRIMRLRPQGGLLFDVGAATGFFMDIAKRFGFAVSGVEIAGFAAEVARNKGLDVTTGTLADVGEQRASMYDVVTMLDVIEHVADPRAELLRVAGMLKSHGLVVINTPDAGSWYARIMGRGWHLIVPPEHLYYFDRSNMTTLLLECGFRVISVGTIGKTFTLSYICKTLYVWLKWPLWKWLGNICQENPFLKRITIPINLYDNFFLIAEKNT
jgi:SAM-dependent methyltransferase